MEDAVGEIALSWPGGGARLERGDDGWRMTEPVADAADETTVDTLLSDLAFLRAEGFVELEPRKGFVVVPISANDVQDLFGAQASPWQTTSLSTGGAGTADRASRWPLRIMASVHTASSPADKPRK